MHTCTYVYYIYMYVCVYLYIRVCQPQHWPILVQTSVSWEGCPEHCGAFPSIPGLLHLMAIATLQAVTNKISLDIAKYPTGVRASPIKND